jgi:S1-C subfamily serine protease
LRKTDIVASPGDSVSVVGFPFGMGQDVTLGLPIWKTGTVASDPDVNFSGRPMFLVDTTSRQGMSVSPVYAVRTGAYGSATAQPQMATHGVATKFLGVYSEQDVNRELGGVWKAEAVVALYDSLS